MRNETLGPTLSNDRTSWWFVAGLITGFLFWAAVDNWPVVFRILP